MNKFTKWLYFIGLIIILNAVVFIFFPNGEDIMDSSTAILEKKRDFTKTVSICIMVKGGIFLENENNNGIGSLFSRVWIKSNKILETVEFYGGKISTKLSPYALEISLSIPTDDIDKVFQDFAQFISQPEFKEDIFSREQKIHLEELIISRDNPNTQAFNGFNQLAYSGSAYALPIEGDVRSVENIKFKDIENYYRDNIKSSYMVVSVAGNYQESLIKDLKALISKLDKGSGYNYNCINTGMAENRYAEAEDSKIKQAKLFIGYEAPDASSEDYAGLKVLTELLGGGMSSRYFLEIRKNSGYAYAVSAAYPSRYCSSRFIVSAGLDYKNVASAIQKIEEINLNLNKTITDDELMKAKKSIAGSTLMETQSNSSLAWNRAFFETMGLGADYYEKYVDVLQNITKEQILKAAEIFKGPKAVFVLKPLEKQN